MNKILLQGSITLAQIFVINMDGYDYRVKEDIGENKSYTFYMTKLYLSLFDENGKINQFTKCGTKK